jgi:hypothetical protein
MRLAALGLLAVAALGLAAAAAAAKQHPPAGVNQLWRQYPLNTATTTPRARARPASTNPIGAGHVGTARPAPARPAARVGRPSPSGGRGWWPVIAIASLVVVALAGVGIRTRKGGGRMTEFRRPLGRRSSGGEQPAADGSREILQPQSPAEPRAAGLNDVGEHIASVLGAAEAAAAKLRTDAEAEARSTKEDATRLAEELRARASEEAESARASARERVEAAKAESSDIRAEADRYAGERRREADVQAAQVVRDAERRAASIAEAAAERHRVVLANIETSESRLRDLAESLRRVAGSLDTIVDDGRGGRTSEPNVQPAEPPDDSLVAALTPTVEAEEPVPAAAE